MNRGMQKSPGLRRPLALGLAAVLAVGACQPAASPSAPGSEAPATEAPESAAPSGSAAAGGGGTFVLTNLSDPDPIDPAAYTHTMSRTLVRNVYDPLVYYKLGTTDLEGYLSTDWSISDDGLVYTFALREGVTFQNGAAFTADDVKASFDRVKAINLTPATYLSEVAETTVIDPLTVEIRLNRPYRFFLGQLPKVPIQSAADITENAGSDNAQTWFRDNANGTGPFRLDSYVRGEQYTLVRNDAYWRPHPDGSIARVIVRPIGDSATQRQLIERGEVDMGSWMAIRDVRRSGRGRQRRAVRLPFADDDDRQSQRREAATRRHQHPQGHHRGLPVRADDGVLRWLRRTASARALADLSGRGPVIP